MRFFALLYLTAAFSAPCAYAASRGPDTLCERVFEQTGELVQVSKLREQLGQMTQYLGELEAHHAATETVPFAFSTPETALALESTYGPIVTFTTFSRELSAEEHFRISVHVYGLLSSLPHGGVIVASGGTMGERGNEQSHGGGVGIVQPAAMSMGFKTLSITAASGFGYKAAPANYLLFALGGFGSESRLMYELSKALVVVGGGGQAYNEATEYLIYNPHGYLILIDDPEVGGTSRSLLEDPQFRALASNHPNIIVAKNGNEAGRLMAEKLGIHSGAPISQEIATAGINILSSNVDLRDLVPGSKVIGFSGWSDFKKAGPDLQAHADSIIYRVELALERIHEALVSSERQLIYSTAGNDPIFDPSSPPAFEAFVHHLPEASKVRYVALSASSVKPSQLSSRIQAISFVSPTWDGRTQQFVSHLDAFVTSGGNRAVIDQTIQAAALGRRQLHISGANTLTDRRLSKIKNPFLKVMSPEEVLEAPLEGLRQILGM